MLNAEQMAPYNHFLAIKTPNYCLLNHLRLYKESRNTQHLDHAIAIAEKLAQ